MSAVRIGVRVRAHDNDSPTYGSAVKLTSKLLQGQRKVGLTDCWIGMHLSFVGVFMSCRFGTAVFMLYAMHMQQPVNNKQTTMVTHVPLLHPV